MKLDAGERLKREIARRNLIDKLKEELGMNSAQIARAIKCDPRTVREWTKQGYLPARHAIWCEIVTKGEFRAVDLASDDL
jgi:hypothetical protein